MLTIKTSFFINCSVVFSVLAILLPAHPGLQMPLKSIGIPSVLLSFVLAVGILYVWVGRHKLDQHVLLPVMAYIAFALIMLVRSLASPALGLENFILSLRGIFVLAPLAILAAIACQNNAKMASRTIFSMGLLALFLYGYILLFGDVLDVAGFRSLSGEEGEENYQSTAFYVGLAAIGFLVNMDYRGSFMKILSFLGFFLIIILMATIGARAAAGAIGFCFIMYYLSKMLISLKNLFWLSLGILVLVVFSVSMYLYNDTIIQSLTVIERFEFMFEDESGSSRTMLFSSAIALWLESPLNFLFGAGLGSYPAYIGKFEPGWYPHNFILETLSEGGIIAVIPILLLVVMVAKKFLSDARLQYVRWEQKYLGYCAIYSLFAYSFIGGLQVLWVPFFFIYSYLSYEPGGSNG